MPETYTTITAQNTPCPAAATTRPRRATSKVGANAVTIPATATTPSAAGISSVRRTRIVARTKGMLVSATVSAQAVTSVPATAGSTLSPRPICGRRPDGSISMVTVANAAKVTAISFVQGSDGFVGDRAPPCVAGFVDIAESVDTAESIDVGEFSDVVERSTSVMSRR